VTHFMLDLGGVLVGGDPAEIAKARSRAMHTLPVIVGFTVGCGLRRMRSRRGPVVAGSAHRPCAARIADRICRRARGERALMSQAGPWPAGLSHAYWPDARRRASTLHSAAPGCSFMRRIVSPAGAPSETGGRSRHASRSRPPWHLH
jgi:hypothetical protein